MHYHHEWRWIITKEGWGLGNISSPHVRTLSANQDSLQSTRLPTAGPPEFNRTGGREFTSEKLTGFEAGFEIVPNWKPVDWWRRQRTAQLETGEQRDGIARRFHG